MKLMEDMFNQNPNVQGIVYTCLQTADDEWTNIVYILLPVYKDDVTVGQWFHQYDCYRRQGLHKYEKLLVNLQKEWEAQPQGGYFKYMKPGTQITHSIGSSQWMEGANRKGK